MFMLIAVMVMLGISMLMMWNTLFNSLKTQ